jgi:hypothetical protein
MVLEQLVEFFEGAALHLGKEKVEEHCGRGLEYTAELVRVAHSPNVIRLEPAQM